MCASGRSIKQTALAAAANVICGHRTQRIPDAPIAAREPDVGSAKQPDSAHATDYGITSLVPMLPPIVVRASWRQRAYTICQDLQNRAGW